MVFVDGDAVEAEFGRQFQFVEVTVVELVPRLRSYSRLGNVTQADECRPRSVMSSAAYGIRWNMKTFIQALFARKPVNESTKTSGRSTCGR